MPVDMSPGEERSPGRAVASLPLATIASGEADAREHEAAEADRRRRLQEKLAKLPELTPLKRPEEPHLALFRADFLVNVIFWGEVISLAFVGPFILGPVVFGRKFTESGYPLLLLFVAPLVLAVIAGFLPALGAIPARERYRTEMEAHKRSAHEAERRKSIRAELRAKYEGSTE